MKANIYALLASFACAGTSVVIDKLSPYNNVTIIAVYSGIQCIICLFWMYFDADISNSVLVGMNGSRASLLALLGILFFVTDYFNVGAYTSGGSLLTITSMFMMYPVFASAIKFALDRKAPNTFEIVGYTLAGLSVLFLILGKKMRLD